MLMEVLLNAVDKILLILISLTPFPLQRLDEALATGIVVGVRRPAHARDHLVFAQDRHVLSGGVLNTTVGVVHQSWQRLPCRNGQFQSIDR